MYDFDNITNLLNTIEKNTNHTFLNNFFNEKYGFIEFFHSKDSVTNFIQYLQLILDSKSSLKGDKNDLGDFQTPSSFTETVCEIIAKENFHPDFLLEPTCGLGNFVISAIKTFPSIKKCYCIELQPKYEWEFKLNMIDFLTKNLENRKIEIEFYSDNIFTHEFSKIFMSQIPKNLLILGNPPWVTNTELEKLGSKNLPKKSNIKKFKGLDSITGKSNFDIAEYILMHLLDRFNEFNGKIGFIVKNTVVRNIVKENQEFKFRIGNIQSIEIDAKKIFNISASASVFLTNLNQEPETKCKFIPFNSEAGESPIEFGWYNNNFIADIEKYQNLGYLEGESPFIWRQGVKHDLTNVMVLKKRLEKDQYENKLNQISELEENLIYPYLKSSEMKPSIIDQATNFVIITQKKIGEDTSYIEKQYPKIWKYLNQHENEFQNRKSSIYNAKPKFSIFGVGDYSFKPYRIGLSGFYKQLNFALIFPMNEKPIMLDDTCYFLSFDDPIDALFTWILLNSEKVNQFFAALVFLDSKRPYTKELLMRLNFSALVDEIDYSYIKNIFEKELKSRINLTFDESKYNQFKQKIKSKSMEKDRISIHQSSSSFLN